MRFRATLATAVALAAGALLTAQFDPDRIIPGGGISVQGWTGQIDASSARQARTIKDAKFVQAGLVGAGNLQSTDGVYGIRFTHNVEAVITGFSMTKG